MRSSSCSGPTIRGSCYYLELRGRGVFLRASPIDVSSIVQEVLFNRLARRRADVRDAHRRRIVRLLRGRLGLKRVRRCGSIPSSTTRASRFSTCRATCPTRARRSSSRRPRARSSRSFAARAAARSCCSRSYTNLREVHRIASEELDTRCSCRARRRGRHCCATSRRTPNAVLLATSSFWQGVDVVGEALSCVIIDKLPFASPGRPDHGGADRGDRRARRIGVRRVSGAAGHPRAEAGPRPPAPSSPGSGRARGPRSAAAQHGLRPAVSRIAAAGAADPPARRRGPLLRG